MSKNSFRVITANTNGIRSAAKKGFFTWLETQNADVVCIQETKAQRDQLDDALFHPQGYHCYYFDAEKKGYSGTALYAKQKPDQVITGLGWASADTEGRYLQADFGKLSVVSLYLPSGSSSEQAQQKKFDFLACYLPVLKEQINSGRDFILCGDWNIAHKPIDLKNWKSNQKNSGFLPEERAWLDTLFDEIGFVDAFRVINQEENQFTWWSNRGAAWEKNVGWRIDYQIVTPALRNTVQRVEIYKAERFSDHAPLIMDYLL
ncbi:MAG TPA: exodeoxyribonuclease III [Pseudomonadales bacterium]|nr:exodeoxyribonuclease III [Cellvibrionales bacterium]HRF87584.1 exodeoxyribonuclease III [Pseudomonadales bacterium]HRG50304.1 exodeoxyribonuclease III [Pseudomonadales bacterium]